MERLLLSKNSFLKYADLNSSTYILSIFLVRMELNSGTCLKARLFVSRRSDLARLSLCRLTRPTEEKASPSNSLRSFPVMFSTWSRISIRTGTRTRNRTNGQGLGLRLVLVLGAGPGWGGSPEWPYPARPAPPWRPSRCTPPWSCSTCRWVWVWVMRETSLGTFY